MTSWSSPTRLLSKALPLFFATSGFLSSALAVEIPPYSGTYNVGATKQVIAINEPDVFAPGNVSTSFLVTLFYPTLKKPDIPGITPYLTQVTAKQFEEYFQFPNGTLANFTTRVQWDAPFADNILKNEGSDSPTLLFGPGLGGPPCECYTLLLSELASKGFTVAAFDHTYEQPYVLYPNGSEYYGPPLEYAWSTEEALTAIDHRINDTFAFIDVWPKIAKKLGFASTTDRFGTFGHSIGGAAALAFAQLVDQSLVPSGINLDGSFWGRLNGSDADVARPSLLLGFEGHLVSLDTSWNRYIDAQTDWWRVIEVNGTLHSDWSDVTFWKELNPPVHPNTGNINSERMVKVETSLVAAFFNWTLWGKDQGELFDEPDLFYPETVLVAGEDGTSKN
ncbi:paf acetylhydrolase family protein [Diaporthe amygdali]|uniref:paf acetylhydrolase family protein n=1 Tax=Phomopsis amygdali TaxID=1214568 RepID=UPI0022FE05FF|nr:paf acetylhydrolase family protein [Diaporthe amygdali]KAJ0106867.1 paf acetylhydrolase family protein [Diaporthe amygdali]